MRFAFILLLCSLLVGVRPASAAQDLPELHVLTYESLAAPEGLGPVLFGGFEKKCGCKVRVQTVGDAAQMVSRLQLERARVHAGRGTGIDVLVGIDDTLWSSLQSEAVDLGVRAKYAEGVQAPGPAFVPLDFGILALMMTKGGGNPVAPPVSWLDLAKPEYRKKLILQDPRTSSPGLGFVWGAVQALGADASPRYFKDMSGQWLTLSPGWSGAYGLFLKGEAPLVWSYTTSLAYHRKQGDGDRYQSVVFKEGNPVQLEGAVAVSRLPLAKNFLEFMVSSEVQNEVPLRQWMYPALRAAQLPREFKDLPKPPHYLVSSRSRSFPDLLREWESWIRR